LAVPGFSTTCGTRYSDNESGFLNSAWRGEEERTQSGIKSARLVGPEIGRFGAGKFVA